MIKLVEAKFNLDYKEEAELEQTLLYKAFEAGRAGLLKAFCCRSDEFKKPLKNG